MQKYDRELRAEIIGYLAKRITSTLNKHRNKILGSMPVSRDEYNPSSILSLVSNGDQIICLDSNTDLDPNWREQELSDFLPKSSSAAPGLDDALSSDGGSATSDDGVTSDDQEPLDLDIPHDVSAEKLDIFVFDTILK